MQRFLTRRLVSSVPVLLGISVLVFVISHVLPGDPVMIAAGGAMGANPAAIQAIRERYGLDRPLYVQYAIYLQNLLRGDLGNSLVSKRPVTTDLGHYFPATVELALAALLLAIGLGVPLGAFLAIRRNSTVDRVGGFVLATAVGMPGFWLAIFLLVLFYALLKVVPGGGRLSGDAPPPRAITRLYVVDSFLTGNWTTLADSLKHLILPGIALAITPLAAIARMVRATMSEALQSDYVQTARAKGLRERAVIYRHALRNALVPAVTQIGLIMAALFNGTVFVETVFSWNGVGQYAVTSLESLDYNPVMAVTLISAVSYMLINLPVDLTYTLIDPRIRYG